MVKKISLFGLVDIPVSKDTALLIVSSLVWVFLINNVSAFFNVVDTPIKLMLYVLMVVITYNILKAIIK